MPADDLLVTLLHIRDERGDFVVHFVFEYASEELVKSDARYLREDTGLRGELGVRNNGDGKWIMDVFAEKTVAPDVLNRLSGRRVEG